MKRIGRGFKRRVCRGLTRMTRIIQREEIRKDKKDGSSGFRVGSLRLRRSPNGFWRHGSGVRTHCRRYGNGLRSDRPVKRSRALLGSNPIRNSRAEGAPQACGPAGENPQAPFLNCLPCGRLSDASKIPLRSSVCWHRSRLPTQKPEEPEYILRLKRGLSQIRSWPFDRQAAREYGRLAAELKRRGRKMQVVD